MAAKASAGRRVSMSTTAPTAPRVMSSHMNQNRSWPGVPNRYRTSSPSSVRRAKSMATVVVDLAPTADTSSTPTDSWVSGASVVSGVISETAPTKVVLPTPNPPATTILTEMGSGTSAPPQAVEQAFEDPRARAAVRFVRRPGDGEEPVGVQVRDEDPGHAERDVELRGDLDHRDRLAAQPEDAPTLEALLGEGHEAVLGRGHERLHVEVLAVGAGAAAGQGVDGHHPGVVASVGARGHGLGRDESSARSAGVSTWPMRDTSTLIS